MTTSITLTNQDIDALSRLVEAEAATVKIYYINQGYTEEQAMRAAYLPIVDSVINRVSAQTSRYGYTIEEVLEKPYQYEPIQNAGSDWTNLSTASQDTMDLVHDYIVGRIDGTETPLVPSATHYMNPSLSGYVDAWNGTGTGHGWGERMWGKVVFGEDPLQPGSMDPKTSGVAGHVFGFDALNADGTYAPQPQPYTLSYDINGDTSINPLTETSGIYDPDPTVIYETPLTGVSTLGAIVKPDSFGVDPSELNAIVPEAGGSDDDGETIDVQYMFKALLDWIASLLAPSPLILDLNGGGAELTSLNSTNSVYWKHDPDSDFAVASGWFTGGDGVLSIDLNEDGIINDSGELFGDQTGFANGFLALTDLDTNTDNKITSADDEWENLRVWIDVNINGYSEADELYTLDELLITEINLNYSNVDYQIAGNNIYQESTFTIDGQTRDIVDAYFKTSTTNTIYNADFVMDWRVIDLPELRGYGELPALGIAMSLDNEDTGNLLDLVRHLKDGDYEPLGVDGDPQQFYAAVEKVMLRWAGVDGVDPDSRGTAIDARYLEFVEKITGQEFTQLGGGPNPLTGPAPTLMEAFGTAHQAVAARLAYQLMDGHTLFDDAPLYNPVTDTFGDSTGVDFDALETFLTHTDYLDHLTAARLAVSWTEEIIGFDNLTTQEVLDFEALLPQNVTLSALLADPQYSIGDAGGFLYGDANDNFMVTPLTLEANVPAFSAGAGNDLLITGPADQTVYGYDGNDTIIAGTGLQTLYGYDGDDLYVFAPGMAQVEGGYYNTVGENLNNGSASTAGQRLEKITFDDETVTRLYAAANDNAGVTHSAAAA